VNEFANSKHIGQGFCSRFFPNDAVGFSSSITLFLIDVYWLVRLRKNRWSGFFVTKLLEIKPLTFPWLQALWILFHHISSILPSCTKIKPKLRRSVCREENTTGLQKGVYKKFLYSEDIESPNVPWWVGWLKNFRNFIFHSILKPGGQTSRSKT